MDASTVEKNGIAIVSVRGRIHGSSVEEFHTPLDELLKQGKPKIILDMSGVEFLSSGGVRVIISVRNRAQSDQGMLKLAHLSNEVRGTLMLVGTELFDIYDTVDQAAASF